MPKTARIGRLNGAMSEAYVLDEDATINDLVSISGEELCKGEALQIDGEVVEGTYVFEDDEKVYIVPSTTGA